NAMGESRADYEIVLELAKRLGLQDEFFGGDIEACWNHQLEPLGITVQTLRQHPEGMRFPQAFAYRKYEAPVAGQPAGFPTPDRRVQPYSAAPPPHGQPAPPADLAPADTPAGPAGAYPL